MFLKDIYLALVSDELDNLKLKDDFEALVTKANGVSRLPEHVFLNFLFNTQKRVSLVLRSLFLGLSLLLRV